jgi:hypothetical protein
VLIGVFGGNGDGEAIQLGEMPVLKLFRKLADVPKCFVIFIISIMVPIPIIPIILIILILIAIIGLTIINIMDWMGMGMEMEIAVMARVGREWGRMVD